MVWTDRARFACGGRCLCKIEVCGREDSKLWGACVRGEPGAARSTQRLSSVRALLQNAPLAVIVEARNAAQCRSATLEQKVAVKFALLLLR
jgi:hypothetical protein